jgi:tripartite-type tricarboxylate transporter receptor subunit TctC
MVAAAQSTAVSGWPVKPARVVVGAPAGSSPDAVARAVAEAMAAASGQPVTVENRVGAGGTLATTAVASATADGHTLLAAGCAGDTITHAFVAQGRPPMELFKDLTPVGQIMRDHWLVVVSAQHPARSLQELAQIGRNAAEPPAYPSIGEASTPHLQGERLAQALGFKALHVPYKDSSAADLASGRLAYAVSPSGSQIGLIKGGRLRALAVLSDQRLAALPDVPTAQEAGLPNYRFNGGICLYAPGATPTDAVARINAALTQALAQAPVISRLAAIGADPTPLTVAQTAQFVRSFAAESDHLRTRVLAAAR